MRLKPSHAARSGVGEHTARESESAQCVRLGRERGELPPPSLALEPNGSGAFLFLEGAPRRRLGGSATIHYVALGTTCSQDREALGPSVLAFPAKRPRVWLHGEPAPYRVAKAVRLWIFPSAFPPNAQAFDCNRFSFGLAFGEGAPKVFRFRRKQDPSVI